MKKVIFVYLICIISLFLLPAIMVKEYKIELDEVEKETEKIKLLISETGNIIEITLDEYIMGVLVGEMPVNYHLEALKAQAVVARTYTLNKIRNSTEIHENADMCDDINHCQAYKTKEYALSCWDDSEENEKWNKIKRAVLETSNMVITYNGDLINAFFHANSGGKTEDISNIWGHENILYLKSVESNEEDKRLEIISLTHHEVEKVMKDAYSNYNCINETVALNWANADNNSINGLSGDIQNQNQKADINDELTFKNYIKILERNSSGRISKIQISNIVLDGTEARNLFGLRSTLFEVQILEDEVVFETVGYGHGVGMSQDGANSMANQGANFEKIIKHYYSEVEIEKISTI